ncbi:MAG: hypothetical protein QM752_07395 [Gammaproteobacteria bacterium]
MNVRWQPNPYGYFDFRYGATKTRNTLSIPAASGGTVPTAAMEMFSTISWYITGSLYIDSVDGQSSARIDMTQETFEKCVIWRKSGGKDLIAGNLSISVNSPADGDVKVWNKS